MSDVNPEQKYAEFTTQDGPGGADVDETPEKPVEDLNRDPAAPVTGDEVEPPD
ncbi:hypothetical protein [Actinoplanes sp. NBRC 101535]|uniref:hypothetical protein n=1 Tax=Actinoplanes sp. NBRC 101535 TaxID=3032196 RepID=UPI0024A42DB8|nr:hypothetical protein [Actinoplanes sp. NBRC 101535]GLY02482.1 hypothetical protein Acsp01_28610 [Actinoplanes sp. NBRC 101535]